MIVVWIRMFVLFKCLIPYRLGELFAVQLVAKSTAGNLLNGERITFAVICHCSDVLLLVRRNAFNVCFVAVGNFGRTTREGVAIINT